MPSPETPYTRLVRTLNSVSTILHAPGSDPAHVRAALERLAACVRQEQRRLVPAPTSRTAFTVHTSPRQEARL